MMVMATIIMNYKVFKQNVVSIQLRARPWNATQFDILYLELAQFSTVHYWFLLYFLKSSSVLCIPFPKNSQSISVHFVPDKYIWKIRTWINGGWGCNIYLKYLDAQKMRDNVPKSQLTTLNGPWPIGFGLGWFGVTNSYLRTSAWRWIERGTSWMGCQLTSF